jgi:hypothetical protein
MNPKVAGLHKPSEYAGYKPGRKTLKRPRRNRQSELVPCNLPRLVTREEFETIQKIALRRVFRHAPQRTYQASILSGLATDARCDNAMAILSGAGHRRRRMRCSQATNGGDCSESSFYVDDAEADMRELLGGVEITDAGLIAEIEGELAAIAREHETPVPPPSREVIEIRRALAALSSDTLAPLRPVTTSRASAGRARGEGCPAHRCDRFSSRRA